MTTLITADLHFSLLRVNAYRSKFVDTLLDMLAKYKADHLLILGDLCEQKDEHPAELVNQVVEHIWRLSRKRKVTLLRGNHDYLSPDSPFFAFVDHIDNVAWINTPTKTWSTGHDHVYFYLPHTDDYERDWANLQFDDCDWIFCHQTFDGVVSESGAELRGIPTRIFPLDAGVISGDIHKPQALGVVTYVGAPYTIRFGDSYMPRVILIDKDKMSSIPCPGPQKRLLECTAGEKLPLTTKPQILKGDIIKVRCKVKQFEPDKWSRFKASVYEWGEKHGFVIHQITPVFARETTVGKRQSTAVPSDQQVMSAYGKKRQVAETVMKTGYWLMEHSS
jgi:predicted phosphodiesterase